MRTPWKRTIRGLLCALLAASAIYGLLIEPNWIGVRQVRIRDSHLAAILRGLTIVHLSDLHIRRIGIREDRVLQLLDELQPDILFLTGDYVAWDGDYEPALEFLSRLRARIGVWGVLGDYDYSNSRMSCLFCHEKQSGKATSRHPVRFIRDAIAIVDLPRGPLLIGGVSVKGEGHTHPLKSFTLQKRTEASIILSHNPLAFDLFRSEPALLMLAGDTHGGQIPLPSFLLHLLGYEKNVRYNAGLFERGGQKLFVSRGIGTSHIPLRMFRRPVIAILSFLP